VRRLVRFSGYILWIVKWVFKGEEALYCMNEGAGVHLIGRGDRASRISYQLRIILTERLGLGLALKNSLLRRSVNWRVHDSFSPFHAPVSSISAKPSQTRAAIEFRSNGKFGSRPRSVARESHGTRTRELPARSGMSHYISTIFQFLTCPVCPFSAHYRATVESLSPCRCSKSLRRNTVRSRPSICQTDNGPQRPSQNTPDGW
jgi:hypothetical protein